MNNKKTNKTHKGRQQISGYQRDGGVEGGKYGSRGSNVL